MCMKDNKMQDEPGKEPAYILVEFLTLLRSKKKKL